MKRIARVLLCLVMAIALSLPLCALSSSTQPTLAVTNIPSYGDDGDFAGYVFDNGGSASFDPEKYCVTCYLMVAGNGMKYVKPSASEPSVNVTAHGVWQLDATGPDSDRYAVWYSFMLLPVSSSQITDYDTAKQACVCEVIIERPESGGITITPDNKVPQSVIAAADKHISPSLKASSSKLKLDVGFYTEEGSSPDKGSPVSKELIKEHLSAIKPYTDTVRFFASSGETKKAYKIAKDMGFKVVGTAWLSGSSSDQAELDALIEHANAGRIVMAVVGSETLYRKDLTEKELIKKIDYVRSKLTVSIPVTTADTLEFFRKSPALREACDVMYVNVYPFWSDTDISKAAASLGSEISVLKELPGSKEVIVSETGWPTSGSKKATADNAAKYFQDVIKWSVSSGTVVFYFDSADEPYKTEAGVGPHWGLMNKKLELKPCFAKLPFFDKNSTPAPTAAPTPVPTDGATPEPGTVGVSEVKIDCASTDIYIKKVNSTTAFSCVITPGNAAIKSVDWTSSKSKVAKIDENGMLTAVKKGKTTISVTVTDAYGNVLTDSVEITVKKNTKPVKKVKLDAKKLTLKAGEKYTPVVTLKPDTAYDDRVTWSSSNKKIAKVSKKGVITAKKKGSCIITAKSASGKKALVRVKVKK